MTSRVFVFNSQVKDVWRESCGFEAALAAISSLDAAFSPSRVEPMDKDGGDTRRLGDGEREVGAPMLGVVSGEGVAISRCGEGAVPVVYPMSLTGVFRNVLWFGRTMVADRDGDGDDSTETTFLWPDRGAGGHLERA